MKYYAMVDEKENGIIRLDCIDENNTNVISNKFIQYRGGLDEK